MSNTPGWSTFAREVAQMWPVLLIALVLLAFFSRILRRGALAGQTGWLAGTLAALLVWLVWVGWMVRRNPGFFTDIRPSRFHWPLLR